MYNNFKVTIRLLLGNGYLPLSIRSLVVGHLCSYDLDVVLIVGRPLLLPDSAVRLFLT